MDQPSPNREPPAIETPGTAMSLPARLLNVFAVPGEVFEEVKTRPPSVANWLLPAVLLAIVMVALTIAFFTQPAIRQQLREQQAKAMEPAVQKGKMKAEDVDKALAMMDKFMLPFGVAAAVVASVLRVFWWAFVLWVLARLFLKSPIGYKKALDVSGLAMMIAVLGGIVTLLLVVNLSKMSASPSLALVVRDFDATRKSHLFLGAANVFSFWLVGLMALGLGKLAGVPFVRAALVVSGYWVLQELLLIVSGLGQMAL